MMRLLAGVGFWPPSTMPSGGWKRHKMWSMVSGNGWCGRNTSSNKNVGKMQFLMQSILMPSIGN